MNSLFTLPAFFQNLSSALNVLTAMLTPALLLSATGSFIISTSNRLGRVVDRVRRLSEKMEEMIRAGSESDFDQEYREEISRQMEVQSKRASLLMRTLMALYMASGLFVLTSVSIGFVSIFSAKWATIPVILGVSGAVMLLVAAIRLITEARLALDGLHEETDFLRSLTTRHGTNSAKVIS
ncbi:DUF2721 domain-containing protein [Bryobacter aggregatus]|uniref:DUF2721 domain-containing protein n=1 Tax=Bryobacter aggregatus TaxID=360054 RepID=UPI0004E25B90|nr:DUF2721 domain-containing protein [Bryobacter aggregatus]